MIDSPENTCRLAKAYTSLRDVARQTIRPRKLALSTYPTLPETSLERRERSLSAAVESQSETFLYLAYGSNLCNETFRGKRGIKPLSQINVQIPELRLTFDLPGVAYSEPCFANTGRRDPEKDLPSLSEKEGPDDYHKNRWHKGLIGVVYEVTATDYAHIIATEGGGASYQDILIDCYPFENSDPARPVPVYPTTKPFKAHTLFAPALPSGSQPPKEGGRIQRPDTSYAQASARYLKLITDGAVECRLPYEYQDYLNDLQPYTITSNKQQMGQFIFLTLWLPFIVLIFSLNGKFADEHGRTPPWLRILSESIFRACWRTYDGFFKPTFGDGERTVPAEDQDGCAERRPIEDLSRHLESGVAIDEKHYTAV
ncbi:hypothetical protein E4T49_01968 [Aureobasidium sp. EXF-10728]|nr:hypothetical protein E4T49_01968 [Aureobasidium sp. EXF-10728]